MRNKLKEFDYTNLSKFLSHVLRNFIEDRPPRHAKGMGTAEFLSHVLRNFIEDGQASSCLPAARKNS